MSSDLAIEVRHLAKCYPIYRRPSDRLWQILWRNRKRFYREFWALKDINFELRKGETLGIIGRNGSGKSTLLQVICGTLKATAGSLQTQGRIAAMLELGSGFNPEFTGRENVYLNATVLGLTQAEIDDRFDAIVAFADIGEFIEQPVKTYSSGMFVRLAFAVIAHVDADLLIIDEALAVGDALFTQKCMRFLREFKARGTLLFVSHDVGAVTALCDRVLWLHKGEQRAFGSAMDISQQYLAAVYEEEIHRGQGVPAVTPQEPRPKTPGTPTVSHRLPLRDPRTDFLNRSNLRNDIQVFAFQPEAASSFGLGAAQIAHVALCDTHGQPLSHVIGGELTCLRVMVRVHEALDRPIIGFTFKDRLGQVLFGDNSYLTYQLAPVPARRDSFLEAEFQFIMPVLPLGDYVVTVAIANGTQEQHVQHHWMHDALVLKSLATSLSTGLIGIPMHSITLHERIDGMTLAS